MLQDLYGLSATQFSLAFALNAAGSIVLGLLNARLVRRFAVRRILVVGLVGSTVAAALLLGAVARRSRAWSRCSLPLFVVVASRGLVSANATVLGIERASAAGSASAVLGACMFAGGVLVTPLLAAGGEGTALPMAAVVGGRRGGRAAGDRAPDPAEPPRRSTPGRGVRRPA